MAEFAQKFHKAAAKDEGLIDWEPLPCLSCARPYADHSDEGGELCPTEDDGSSYVNPDAYTDPDTWGL